MVTVRHLLGLPIPDDASLAGVRFSMQAVVVDPDGAFEKVGSFSNGVRLTLGR